MNELHERKQVADEKLTKLSNVKKSSMQNFKDKQIAEDKIAEIKEHKNK